MNTPLNHLSWLYPRNWRLSAKLIVAMTALSLVSLILSVVVINYATTRELEHQVSDALVAQATLEGQHIAEVFAQQVNLTVASLSTDPEVLDALKASNEGYLGSDAETQAHLLELDAQWRAASETEIPLIEQTIKNPIADKLRLFLGHFPGYAEIFITDRYGAEIAGSGRTSDYYQADEDWWQAGWNDGKGGIYFGAPELDESANVVAIEVTVPVVELESGEVLGVVKAVYNITSLIEDIGAFTFGRTGQAQLIDAQGNFVGGQTLDSVGTAVPAPLLLDGRIFAGTGFELNARNESGENVVVGYAPMTSKGDVPEIDQLGWVVRVEQDRDEAFAPVGQLHTVAGLFTIFAALSAAGVALLVGRNLTRALTRLTDVASQFGAGNLTIRAQVHSRDEIGQLAGSFNGMADQINGLIGTLEQRVSETQAALERAEKADRVKTAFLASVSHELRTPLNSIINFTKFVVREMMGPINQRQKDALTNVVNSSKQLLDLINDVLDISKIEAGSLNLFVEEDVDINDILSSVVSTAQSSLTDKPVELRLDIDNDLPLMVGDRQRILQIVLNMVSNACKFTQEGYVKISAHCLDGEIRLAVEDSGPGVAPEDYELVFEPFRQTETGLRHGGGTGLGMPISKRLAEAHGGRLWFESTPGERTIFYVAIPVKSKTLTPVAA